MTNDLISREAAIHAVNAYDYRGFTVGDVKIITEGCAEELLNLPSIDAEPVRHGRWIDMGDFESCSLCQHERLKQTGIGTYYGGVTSVWVRTNYCPHCGAKMDLEESDENA